MPTIKDSSSIEEVLQYIVACYGVAIYQEKQRLSNLIADLYTGEERLKRLYRRMVIEDAVSQQLYAISLKPIQEREGFYNRLVFQFKEANFYEEAFARQVLDVFLHGMNLLLVEPISTKATIEDGEWVDEFGAKYSADRKKLIRPPKSLCRNYHVLDGTVVICDGVFYFCKTLQEITLPSSVTSIGDRAFVGCWNLQKINVAESNKVYKTIDGVVYTKDLKTIICYPQGKMNRNFVIPSGVTSIGNYAFYHCENLQGITLPPGVTSIEDDAFYWCENLQEINIPSSVISIGDYAFSDCRNLREINVAESNKVYRTIDGVVYTKDLKTIICYPAGKKDENFVILSGVTSIGNNAFYNCNKLREINIPSSVTSIGERTFDRCENLQEITLPQGVISIGERTFEYCSNLREITLPSSITNIGNNAFYNCNKLREITIPSSVTSIEDGAFWNCDYLQEITLPSSVMSIRANVFVGCKNLKRINIPAGTLEKFKELLPGWTDKLHEV